METHQCDQKWRQVLGKEALESEEEPQVDAEDSNVGISGATSAHPSAQHCGRFDVVEHGVGQRQGAGQQPYDRNDEHQSGTGERVGVVRLAYCPPAVNRNHCHRECGHIDAGGLYERHEEAEDTPERPVQEQ